MWGVSPPSSFFRPFILLYFLFPFSDSPVSQLRGMKEHHELPQWYCNTLAGKSILLFFLRQKNLASINFVGIFGEN